MTAAQPQAYKLSLSNQQGDQQAVKLKNSAVNSVGSNGNSMTVNKNTGIDNNNNSTCIDNHNITNNGFSNVSNGSNGHHVPNGYKNNGAIADSSTGKDDELTNVHGFYFLSSTSSQNGLLNFVFQGEDRSLVYKYALSPLAKFCVENCIPKSVAPNTITFTGLLFMITSYCIIWYYAPMVEVELEDPSISGSSRGTPNWVFIFHGICMLIYQTLDNCDGKQARRTNTSSALGSLFDHGVDAVNSIFGSANWIIAMGLQPRSSVLDCLMCWYIVFGPYTLFYSNTWEEYNTGQLILPPFNGPSEGLLLGVMLSFTSGIYGPNYWQSTTWYDIAVRPILAGLSRMITGTTTVGFSMRNADFVVLAAVIGCSQEIIIKCLGLVRKKNTISILYELQPVCVLCVATLIIGCFDNNQGYHNNIFLRNPRTSLHLFSCLFVEMTTQLMLSHVTHQTYCYSILPTQRSKFGSAGSRWILLPLVLFAILVLLQQILVDSPQMLSMITLQDHWLTIYATAGWSYLLFKMVIVINEICQILDVYCFDIVTPPRRSQKEREAKNKQL